MTAKKVTYIWGYTQDVPLGWSSMGADARHAWLEAHARHGQVYGWCSAETAIKKARQMGIAGQFEARRATLHLGGSRSSADIQHVHVLSAN